MKASPLCPLAAIIRTRGIDSRCRWEYFRAHGAHFLAVPNYYGKTTAVYRWCLTFHIRAGTGRLTPATSALGLVCMQGR